MSHLKLSEDAKQWIRDNSAYHTLIDVAIKFNVSKNVISSFCRYWKLPFLMSENDKRQNEKDSVLFNVDKGGNWLA